jgi:hypothetical protein
MVICCIIIIGERESTNQKQTSDLLNTTHTTTTTAYVIYQIIDLVDLNAMTDDYWCVCVL